MPELSVVLGMASGLHARAAARVVETARLFDARVTLRNASHGHGRAASATSMLGLLSLGAARGDRLLIDAEGPDADGALRALGELLASAGPRPNGR